jgi:hypothetical protein
MNSTAKPALRLDWATHEAAKFACLNWHYSRSIPVGKLVRIGVWEGGKFIGVVLFSWGANNRLGQPYGLGMLECCELVRVALTKHVTPVSRIMAVALKFLRKQSPGIRLVVSFADPVAGHHGGIYQAGGWIYSGTSAPSYEFWHQGRRLQKRAYTGENYGAPKMALPLGAEKRATPGKHRYLMPLDAAMRAQLEQISKPYPKRLKQAMADTLGTAAEHHRPKRSNELQETCP